MMMIGVLFCGGGCLDFGFPISPSWVVDLVAWNLTAYRLNHRRETITLLRNLIAANPLEVITQTATKKCDLLWASPPCQPWSTANGAPTEWYDPLMMTLLVPVKFARILRPEWIVVENVRGLLERRPGKMWLRWLCSDLRRLGYSIAIWQLNAINHGGCQIRNRIFVIARRDKQRIPPPPTPKFSAERPEYSVWDVIGGLSEDVALADGCQPMSQRWQHDFASVPPGGVLPGTDDRRRMTWDVCQPLRTSPCIVNSANFVHPTLNRFLSVREYAKLMGVADYRFPIGMPVMQKYCIVGQGVPPILAKAVTMRLFS